LKWDGELRFVAENENGAAVIMEPGPAFGGTGRYPAPMEVLAMSLGGCTGMDMVLILEKMKVQIKRMSIEVETKRKSQEPRYYEEIHILYKLSGDGLTHEKAKRAAALSNEKYCSVGIMLQDKAKITYDVVIDET
jgi:putative redox protein